MGIRRERLVSQWYGTSVLRLAGWAAGLGLSIYLIRAIGEFVANAAKAVAP